MIQRTDLSSQVSLPGWMYEKTDTEKKETSHGNHAFIKKTLVSISNVILNDLISERYSEKKGMMQSIDPRVKLISMLFFMLFTGITRSVLTLVLLTALAAMLVVMSKMDFISYMKRVWMLIPFIMLIVSVPAATNLFAEGDPVAYLYRSTDIGMGGIRFPEELYFSLEGITMVVKTVIRVGTSISFGYVLMMSTRWNMITKALSSFRVPKIIVAVLDMTYRYVFVLCNISMQIFEARYLRTVGVVKNREGRRFVSNSVGFLFIKANHLSEEIYDSMLCRGYTGETVSLKEFKLSPNDYVWIVNNMVIAMILLLI